MSHADAKQPITSQNAMPAARDIIARLVARWRDGGLPPLALAEALLDAGVQQVVRTRGPAPAAAILLGLADEFKPTTQTKQVEQQPSKSAIGHLNGDVLSGVPLVANGTKPSGSPGDSGVHCQASALSPQIREHAA